MILLSIKSILLVDDDEISNLFNQIFIRKLDIDIDVDVDVVLDGKAALEKITSFSTMSKDFLPCLLLLDIKMPKMDGWQFLASYEATINEDIKNKIVIVMLTTSENERDAIKAMKNPNIKEYIQKPLSEQTFSRIIKKHFKTVKAN